MRILFMLPARSGSKGLPDKNIKPLCGKPLMWYAINAVKSAQCYNADKCCVFVNTDSKEYAIVAQECGAEVPYIRDANLATDQSTIRDTIEDAFTRFGDESFDVFALIQVTSPLISPDDIDNAITQIRDGADSALSVTESEVMPLWCGTLDESMLMNNFIDPKIRTMNRQELPTYYRITGSVRAARWLSFKKFGFDWYKGVSKAVMTKNESAIDIDTLQDFQFAEFLMKRKSERYA